jgi:hypothetical protein
VPEISDRDAVQAAHAAYVNAKTKQKLG